MLRPISFVWLSVTPSQDFFLEARLDFSKTFRLQITTGWLRKWLTWWGHYGQFGNAAKLVEKGSKSVMALITSL